jgi:hypothetical protein
VTNHRSWQRQCARLGAIFVAIGAMSSVIMLENAAATSTTVEPSVAIGESRSIERSESTDASAADASSVGGVAVAGVAIARDAPTVAYRLDTDVPDSRTNALPFFIGGLCAVAVMVAALWLRLRRLRTITA